MSVEELQISTAHVGESVHRTTLTDDPINLAFMEREKISCKCLSQKDSPYLAAVPLL